MDLSPKAAEIAACARLLVATRGYNGFSYADIAEAVGISKPSVHHHFASKADLVHAVVVGYRADALAGLAQLDASIDDPLARLGAWIGFLQTCLRERTLPFCVCAMLATEMPAIPEQVGVEVRGHFDDLSGWLAAVLSEGARSGRVVLHGSAPAEALTFMATVHGAMVAARAYDDTALFATITEALVGRFTPRR